MDKPNHELYKYPRTPHLPTSLGMTSDDKMASKETLDYLKSGIELTSTLKLDGGNLSFYSDYFHGRSLDSGTHHWDQPAKALWARIRHDIPEGWRISGESMYARRSVAYENLPGVYIVFGIWDETNTLISYDEMVEWAGMLGLPTVPLIYRGNDYEEALHAWEKEYDDSFSEGFVMRDAGRIAYEDFDKKIAKYVRFGHVQTAADWRHRDDYELNTFAK
jgi:hypothetical protein